MHTKILTCLLLLSATFVMLAACSKGTEPTPVSVPVLTTATVTNITATSAFSGGNITSDGGSAVTARGICWSTNATPTIADNKTTDGTGTGSFSSSITGLTLNTRYYVRAYATNGNGTGYGNAVTFIAGTTEDPLAYFGQTPPGRTFVQFAPGIVPAEMYHSVTVSPDGQEIYWAARTGIMVTKLIDGHWTTPQIVSFSGGNLEGGFPDDAPVVSPDNRKFFFTSRRAYGSSAANSRYSFWYCERTASGWSEAIPMPEIINSTGGIHWQASVSNSGTFYFGIYTSGIGPRIYYSRFVNGVYTTPEPITIVNNLGSVQAPFIAPDESYIIFNKVIGQGETIETYISFKGSNNEWLQPQRMTQFPGWESSFVTRDGKYIFCKNYWASAQIIEDLRPRN